MADRWTAAPLALHADVGILGAGSMGVGIAQVVTVLDNLRALYGDPRYRVSPLLRRKAITGTAFHNVPNRTASN